MASDKQALKSYVRKMDSVVNYLKFYDELMAGNEDLASEWIVARLLAMEADEA